MYRPSPSFSTSSRRHHRPRCRSLRYLQPLAAVRTAPNENWTRNGNIISISAVYILVGSPLIRFILTVAKAEMHDVGQLVISLAFCPKRWLLVRLKLARVP